MAHVTGNERVLLAGPVLLSFALSCATMAATLPTSHQIDDVFRSLADQNSPGLAVVVLKDGKTVFQRGYGKANLESGAAITPQTDFRLASFTKQFTATCIMLLVHDGKLNYDDTLTKVFPRFPAYGSTVTVRMLLSHTA